MPDVCEIKAELKRLNIKGITGKRKGELLAMLPEDHEFRQRPARAPRAPRAPRAAPAKPRAPRKAAAAPAPAPRPRTPSPPPIKVAAARKVAARAVATPARTAMKTIEPTKIEKQPYVYRPTEVPPYVAPVAEPAEGGAGAPHDAEMERKYKKYSDDWRESVLRHDRMIRGFEEAYRSMPRDHPNRQLAGMYALGHHEPPPRLMSYTQFVNLETAKMEREAAEKAAAEAARAAAAIEGSELPEKFKKIIDNIMTEKQKYLEKISAQTPEEHNVNFRGYLEMPAKRDKKSLEAVLKAEGIKGYSGKTVADLIAMIEKANDSKRERNIDVQRRAIERVNNEIITIEAVAKLMSMSKSKLESLLSQLEKAKRATESNPLKTEAKRLEAHARRTRNSEDIRAANEAIRKANDYLTGFVGRNQQYFDLLKEAIHFKETGKMNRLESYARGTFYETLEKPLDAYIAEFSTA